MGKRKTTVRKSSDDGATVYPVFVDTNLDTHLALIVSDTDTVSDLKRKIKLEHPRCFPVVGKVKIKALQVKRRGHLYRLPDSMLVKSAFGGAKRSWFVYVDASSAEEQSLKQHIRKLDSSNQLALPWVTDCPSSMRLSKHHESSALQSDQRFLAADQSSQGDSYLEIPKYAGIADNHGRNVDSDSNKRSDLEVQKYDTGSEGIVSKKRLPDMQRVSPMEGDSESVPAARKKRKTKRNEHSGNTFVKDKALIFVTTDVTSKADGTNQEIFCLNQGINRNATSDGLVAEAMDDDHISPISVCEKKKKNKKRKDNIISVKPLNQLVTVVPEVQDDEEKRTFKENVENIHNHSGELVQEVFEGIKAPFSTMNFSKDEEEVFPTPLIRELHDLKKNGHHSVQNNIGVDDQTFEGNQVDKCKQNQEVLFNLEVKLTEWGERVYRGDKDASYKEPDLPSKLSDPKGGMESENVGKKKKRKTKKSSTRNEDESVLKDGNEGVNHVSISGPNSAFDGHLTDEARKEGSILSDKGKEVPEEKAADAEKVISNEPEITLTMTTVKNQRNVEDLNEKSRKKSDRLRGSKRKDSAKKCASRNENESVVKHDNNDPCATEKEDKILLHTDGKGMSEKKPIESHMTAGGEGENLLGSGAEILQPTETNRGKLVEDVIVASKECENGTNRKKKKVKKSTAKEEDASVMKLTTDAVTEPTSAVPNLASDGRSMEKLQKDECVSSMEAHGTDETRKEGGILSDKGKEVPEEKAADAEKVISNEPEISLTMTTDKKQRNEEDLNEKSRKKSDSLRGSKRKDGAKKCASRNENESVVKHDNDDPCATEKEDKILLHTDGKGMSEKKPIESHMTAGGEGENPLGSGAEILQPTERNRGKLIEDVIVASKECENGTNRKKKKVKKSTAKEEDASVMKLTTDAVTEPTSAVPNLASDGRSMEKLQKDECVSSMERTGLPEVKAVDAPQRVPDRESDDVMGNEAETLRSNGIKRSKESVKDKSRSRRNKSQSNTSMSFQGFPNQEQEGGVDNSHPNKVDRNQEYSPRTDKGMYEETREVTDVSKSKPSGLEQSSELELETEKSNGIEHASSLSQKMDVFLSEVPSSIVIENIVEADNGYQVNVSNGEGEGIDFKQYFVPGEKHNEGAPNNKVKEAKKSERFMKSKKNKEKVVVPSVGTSDFQQKLLLSANKHGDDTSQTKFVTSTQSKKPLSVAENNEIVSSSKKSPKVYVDEMKAPNSHPIDQIKTRKMAGQSDVARVSKAKLYARTAKRNNGSLVGSSSNSDGSVRSRRGIVNNKRDLSLDQSDMADGKTAAKTIGEVVNNSQRMKSLLATPGTIFGDDSSISSADDNGTVDSDASTRTPSDRSLSSESEGESNSSLDLGRNGSSAAKGKGRRSYLVDSQSSEMKDKSFGEILRSSSRFKKAKLTASQYQEEDAEDIDFVRDSHQVQA